MLDRKFIWAEINPYNKMVYLVLKNSDKKLSQFKFNKYLAIGKDIPEVVDNIYDIIETEIHKNNEYKMNKLNVRDMYELSRVIETDKKNSLGLLFPIIEFID